MLQVPFKISIAFVYDLKCTDIYDYLDFVWLIMHSDIYGMSPRQK